MKCCLWRCTDGVKRHPQEGEGGEGRGKWGSVVSEDVLLWQRPQDIPQEEGEGRGKGASEVLSLEL